MAAHGQQNFGIVPEITVSVAPAAPGFVMDSTVSPPTMEQQQQTLGPFRHQLIRDSAVVLDNPPGYVGQNRAQAAQQPYGGGGADPSACFQYEDFAGMLGERFLSGSLSDVSASASDKVYSGYSSSGEHHGQRVKLMCSFGGKILPRPGDGKLRYAGGDTRIISVYRHIKYGDLLQKMGRLYGQPVLSKYQLPNEDLDALISISCDEDVENMMEEYDRLQASEGSSRLRIFLFPLADHDLVHVNGAVDRNTDQSYMNAINGMLETRPVSMVPLSSSNIVTGQQIPDVFSASRILNNSSYAFPVASNPQLASALGQSVPTGMLQQQLLSNIGPAVSPPTPPSPTISSQLPQIRQPGTSNAFFPFYGDHVLKGPTTQIHEHQRIDAVYQDDVGAGSGTSSLNSQQDGHYRHFDAPRLIDSPRKPQYESMLDHAHQQEQFFMAESMHPKMTQNCGMSHPDSYGRLPRVGSDRSLMALQQQQLDVSGPVGRPSDVLQPSLDLQNLVIHDQGYPPQSAWQHPRQEFFQRLRPVRLSAPDNIQGLAVASQQLRVSPYPSPVVIPSHEVAAYNQLDQSGGVMSGFLLQKPPALQTSIQSPGTGHFYAQPGSPSSPRVRFQDMNSNHSAVHPVFAGHAGFSGGFGEPLAQPQIEPVLRGLKPLNTRLNPHEQLLFVDDPAARQQLLSPLSKHQETRGGPRQQEGDHIQGLYSDGLIWSRTPPYPGGSPYSEHLTAFSDQRLVQGEGQEQMQHDDSFGAYSNHQEGFDWTMKKPQSEKTSVGWSGLGQVDLKGESSMLFNVSKATEPSPAYNTQESSFANPSPSGATYFDSHVPSGINFMPAAGPQTNLDGVKFSNAPTYLPTSSEVPFGDSNVMGASTENQLLKSAPFPVANISGNVNSLFEADLKEGRWVKGIPAEARPSEKSERLSVEHKLEINDGPFLGGRLGRRASDKDARSPDEPFRSPDAEHSNVTVNRNKPNDTFYTHMQLPTSLGTSNLADLGSRQNLPLSPRISAGNSPLGSPSLSRPMEASTGASCLSEVVKDYNCGDFVSFIQTDDLELPRSEFAFSNTDRPVNTQYVSLVTSSQATNSVDAKDDFPIFDSESVEASKYKDIGSNKAPASAEVDLLPSSLYSAPTLSMQNWETSLETTRVEDILVEKNQDTSDHIELHVVEREVLEVEGGKPLDDADGNNANTSPAAMAEAEAVSRGLQTIKNADLEELQELGTGTFGTVFHGKWRGTDVAIKRIKSSCFSGKPSERDRLIADFWKEAYILGQLHHPNVVAFYGVVPDGPGATLATVTEYMVNGSLKQVLHKKDRTIDRRKRLLIIMDAAFGMEYLHGKNIVHFDLKCENLLVNMKDPHRPICKVGDLGLSKVKQQTMVSGGVRGTLPWMAPELLNGSSNLVSEKVDVYSFGIVMWELLTGEEPYAKMHYGAIIGGIVNNTLRPPIPSWCDPLWKALMEKCWSADPQERPAFVEISAELRTMANSKSQGQISGPPN